MHLLLVEDDPRLARRLARLLTADLHVVEVAATGDDALALVEAGPALDALILDVGLPDLSGLAIARRLRSRGSRLPILMLTAHGSLTDRIEGLDAGADDYLVKPFAYEELSARLRSLVRRSAAGPLQGDACLVGGPIALDEARRLVTVGGRAVDLTPREFALLECLLRHPGAVLNRDQLLDLAWPSGVAVTPNTVDAFVVLLRRKLGPEGASLIETVRGVGYRLSVSPGSGVTP
jgi:DNA-binding response OmpR family regulator